MQRRRWRRIGIGVLLLRLPREVGCKKSKEEVAGVVGQGLDWGDHGGSTNTVFAVEVDDDGRI